MEDYTDIGAVNPMRTFNAKLAEVAQKFLKKRKPFDEQCARLEFRDKIESAERESERRHGFVKVEEIKVDFSNLEKYGDDDRFVFIEDQEDVTEKFVEGTKMQIAIGHTLSYRCKKRGHGISVFIPIEEYKNKKDKKEK